MTPPPSDRLCLRLLGPFEATRGGLPLPGLHVRDGERLLAYLTLRTQEPVPARELAERFWPAEARGNLIGQNDFPTLRQALFTLRKALGSDAERLTRPSKTDVHLDLTGVEVDVLKFDSLALIEPNAVVSKADLSGTTAWEVAISLSLSPLLEGWSDAWVVEARKRRQRTLERLLRRLAQDAQQKGEDTRAEPWLRRLLGFLPHDETAARDLIRLLGARRQYAEANEVKEALAEALQAQGRSLEPETLTLMAALRTQREQQPVIVVSPPIRPTDACVTESLPMPLRAEPVTSPSVSSQFLLEPAGGAVPVGSPFYVKRPTDAEFAQAVLRRDSIVLVKGARQVGKTSLLAHALQQARESGMRVVISDFQNFNETQFSTPDTLLLALATDLAVQLDLETMPREVWDADSGPNMNLGLYLRRHALRAVSGPLVWALDEVDRLFSCSFSSEVFGLFRSWHNARALDPESPWTRLTLAIAYSTEASLFITDLNQSPFNVGTRLALQDFTLEQTALLNDRYGSPLSAEDRSRFYQRVGGQPYLTRRGLDELVTRKLTLEQFEAESVQEDGLFGEHLRRMLAILSRSEEMVEVVRALLDGKPCESQEAFFRLRSAGVLSGASYQEASLRCRLYIDYLTRHLG